MTRKIKRNLDGVAIAYRSLIDAAIDKMAVVLDSQEFKDAMIDVINHSDAMGGELSEWKHKTVKEIYENLFDADGSITLNLFTYYSSKKVIGYGVEANTNIYMNIKYLSAYEIDDLNDLKLIGSNLIHEHGHDCGYEHDFKATARRKNSICYLLNDAYEIAFDKIYGTETEPVITYTPWYKRIFKWSK